MSASATLEPAWDTTYIRQLFLAPVHIRTVLPINGSGHISTKRPIVAHVEIPRDMLRGRRVFRANERACTRGRVKAWGDPVDVVTCPACIRVLERLRDSR